MLLRLTDFIAGGRRDDLEREIEEPDVDEFVESQDADEKLRIKEFLLMVRKFVKGKIEGDVSTPHIPVERRCPDDKECKRRCVPGYTV